MSTAAHEFDVVVVGAGPAGIAAACAAGEAGRRVAVLDNSPWLGGQIWRGEEKPGAGEAHPKNRAARAWLERVRKSGAKLYFQATVFAAPEPGQLLADTSRGTLHLAWRKLILATGARELFLPFPGWTLPGVVGPGGLHAMAKAGWPMAGKRVVVAGTGPLLLAAADGLKQQGAQITLVAEQAPLGRVARFGLGLWRHPGKVAQGLAVKSRLLGVPYRCGCWPVKAEGEARVGQVTLTDGSRVWTESCDYLACGFHLVPNLELPRLLGCEVAAGVVRVHELQETSLPDVFCAGEPTGVAGVECALVEGTIAGLTAAGGTEKARAWLGRRAAWHRFRSALHEAFALRPELRGLATADTVICRCEDVKRGRLEACADWRSAKLHTRCGMGPCQGRVCGPATRHLFGWENVSVRSPLDCVSVGALANCETTIDHDPETRT